MLIERGQTIAGEDAVELRALLRRLIDISFTEAGFERLLGAAPHETRRLFELLAAEGLVERAEPGDSSRHVLGDAEDYIETALWRTSIAGNAVAKARIGRAMARAQAEVLLAAVIERAQEINEDPTALFYVETIELFGSMLRPDVERVGDVDLRALVAHRLAGDDHIAEIGRRWPGSLVESGLAAIREVSRRLTGGLPRIDLQLDEAQLRPIPCEEPRVVYSRS